MDIHALKLTLTEQDLNDLVRKYLPADHPIEDLTVRVQPGGLTITGIYPLFINVHFETLWYVAVADGKFQARLRHFKAMGVPGNVFKSAILKIIEDLAGAEDWVRLEGDALAVDIDACIAKYAFPARTHLTAVTLADGSIGVTAQGP